MRSLLASTNNTRFLQNGCGFSSHIIRSDTLDACPESDIQYLKQIGISNVIDLRDPKNKKINPYFEKCGLRTISYPLPARSNTSSCVLKDVNEDYFLEYYLFLLRQFNDIKGILKVIDTISGGILIYCALGRDRTGVISFIIQMIGGIDYQTIVEDIALSDNMLLNAVDRKEVFTQFDVNYLSARQRANKLIEKFNNLYGNALHYLKMMGFSAIEIFRLAWKLSKLLYDKP